MEWVASGPALYQNTFYPALLLLMRTPRLPAADSNDTPADINGLVRFAGRPNLVSAHVPSHSVFTLPVTTSWHVLRLWMEERPPIWRVAANTLNKQLWTADKGWYNGLGFG